MPSLPPPFLRALCCATAILLASAGTGLHAQEAPKPPNIVFILIDDLGWADLGCYGNNFNESPNIDRLAAEGMRFTDFYAAASICSPTRASIFSGQYPARLGMTDFVPGHWRPYEKLIVPQNAGHLPLELTTPAEALKTKGYATGYFGKWHLGGGERHHPKNHGFDEAIVTGGRHFRPKFNTNPKVDLPDGTYLADFLTDQTIGFIKDHKDEPFFVVCSHFAVHIPIEAKKETYEKYLAKPKPERGVNHPMYAAMIENLDTGIGRIMDTLREQGLEENTLVVFTSDNGGLRKIFSGIGEIVTSNAPLRNEKGSIYEGGVRVPLIARWPAVVEPGQVEDEPTISVDFLPTFADLAGASHAVNQPIDGVSLRPLLEGKSELDRDAIYFHYPHYHHDEPASAVRAGRWKLMHFYGDNRLELYDLETDISESFDYAQFKPELAQQLDARLTGWLDGIAAALPQPNPDYDPEKAKTFYNRRNNQPINAEGLGNHYGSRVYDENY